MIILPSGEKRWPSLGQSADLENQLQSLPPIKQFQLIQKTRNEIEAHIVAHRPLTPADEVRLRDYLIATLAHPFEIRFVYPDHIPRGPTGKYEDFRCETT